MATEQTRCDECEKKDCPQKIVGAMCSLNKELIPLINSVKSRDPILMANFIVKMVGNEYERYEKAKKVEDIGGVEVKTFINKHGKEYTVCNTKTIDNNVSNLAMNIIKCGKILSEILNPPKKAPINQTNYQFNYGAMAAEEIRNMGGIEKEKALKFIDEKLDAKRPN
jgi:hypothetical protein